MFSNSYRLSRLFGLTPDQKSFLFKLLQNLLPTRERLSRCGKAQTAACLFCAAQSDNLEHIFECPQSTEVTTPLLACLTGQVDNLTANDITLLNIRTTEAMDLPCIWLISLCLSCIWEQRMSGKVAKLEVVRAELLARLSLLRSTNGKIILFTTAQCC